MLPTVNVDEVNEERILETLKERVPFIFQAYAAKRQPRTSALVKGARTQGQTRVVTAGPEACRKRNEKVAAAWKDVDNIAAKYNSLCCEPFQVAA